MYIIRLNEQTITAGKAAFNRYIASMVEEPQTGLPVVVGAITGAIEHGMTLRQELVHSVSRASLCRPHTVELVLDELTGNDLEQHLWGHDNGHYFLQPSAHSGVRGIANILLAP